MTRKYDDLTRPVSKQKIGLEQNNQICIDPSEDEIILIPPQLMEQTHDSDIDSDDRLEKI